MHMPALKSFLIAAVFVCIPAPAETKWIHLRSENFEMFSSAGAGSARETLRNFEQVRTFFIQALKRNAQKDPPVYIVGFNSEKEYAPYRPSEFAAAHYHPGADRDYIVMSRVGYNLFPVAVHEYVHLVVQHAGFKFPPWLNEGFAELYSTLKPRGGDRIIVGDLIPGRYQALLTDKWVPLSIITAADHDSPYYNERDRAGSLYNEGWALVHMLILSEAYRPKSSEFIAAIQEGVPAATAFERVYSKSITQVDKELQAYLRGDRFRAALVPAKLEKVKAELPAEPAPELELNLVLADLTNRRGNEAETERRLTKLAGQNPQRAEPAAGLAYLSWYRGNLDEAEKHFAKAFELGDRNPRLLWDYGRIARRSHPEEALKALEALSLAQPDRVEVRLEMASLHLSHQQAGKAYAVLNEIRRVTPADAPRLFLLRAYAQLGLGGIEAARASTEEAAKYVKAEFDKDELERLRAYVEQARTANLAGIVAPQEVKNLTPAAESEETAMARRMVRRVLRPDGTYTAVLEPPKTVAGTFAEFVCSSEKLKIAITTQAGRKVYLIDDPSQLTVVGREGGKVELECGPQKPVPIRIEYTSAPGTDVEGIARIVYFDQ
jgi:Flp pilus assembly protein TadD